MKFTIEDRGYETPCWIWQQSKNSKGYGQQRQEGKTRGAHVIAYEEANGPVPEGLELDHLCSQRDCVNAEHLEAVTHLENMRRARKTHCVNGHRFDAANTYQRPDGKGRQCRACKLDRVAA